jgi:ATPase subunit of ABC transporter with duplicated ATPase domains
MLQVNDVSYSVGDRQVLNSVSFSLMPQNKVALVGVNGAGKTTLLRIIMGELSPDEGEVIKPARVGYVPQIITEEIIVQEGCTVEEFMLEGRGLNELSRRIHEMLRKMGEKLPPKEMEKVLSSYSRVQEDFFNLGGYEAESEIETILQGIGSYIPLDRIVSSLSGGEKTKLAFARSLFANSDLLILDEPTNHIDRQHYAWLGNYLKNVNKTVIVVSHHPDFVNPFTRKILEIEKYTGRMREYHGTYDDYVVQSALNEQALMRQVEWLDKEIGRLTQSALRLQHGGPNKASAAQNMFGRVGRLKKQREEIMEEMPQHERALKFKFPVSQRSGQVVASVMDVSKSFGTEQIFHNLNFEVQRNERVVVLGPNGSGKTTAIRILMGLVKPDSGKVNLGYNVVPGYYAQEHEDLDQNLSVLEEIQAASYQLHGNLRSILGRFLFSQEKTFQKISTLSQGEKSRLSLCKLIVSGCNFLIMDEPTNYLDPVSRDAVCEALLDFEGTVLFISHDYTFIKKVQPNRAIIMPSGESRLFSEDLLSN